MAPAAFAARELSLFSGRGTLEKPKATPILFRSVAARLAWVFICMASPLC